jgi:glycosyltransferase involved in cell wall biosynthesis
VSRIVILAPVHSWDDVRVFQKEARTLANAGFDVVLMAQTPGSDNVNGVHLLSAPASNSRIARFFKLPVVLREALRLKGAVYHLHNPDTLPIALALKVLRRRVIYDTHEDFSKRLLIREWIPQLIRRPLGWFIAMAEAMIGRLADGCICTQADVCKRLGNRAILIGNPPITEGPMIEAAYNAAKTVQRGAEVRLVYAGVINRARGLDFMVDALASLNAAGVEARLWLIGPAVTQDLNVAMARPGGAFVDYLGKLPQVEAFGYMIKADVGLVTILDIADHRRTSPNKLYEYLVFGLPVVASDFPDWRQTLPEEAGVCYVRPGCTAEIVSAVTTLTALPDRGRSAAARGRDYVVKTLSWEREADKLLGLYRSMTASRGISKIA